MGAPVGQTSCQLLISAAVVQFEHPGRGDSVAVVVVEHGAKGSDDAGASVGGHGRLLVN